MSKDREAQVYWDQSPRPKLPYKGGKYAKPIEQRKSKWDRLFTEKQEKKGNIGKANNLTGLRVLLRRSKGSTAA